MGIIKKIIHNSSGVFIWKIEESENELLQKIDKNLLTGYHKIKKPNHKIQWLASRALLSQVLKDKKIQFTGLIKDEFGKPHLNGNKLKISISHTFNYTALIISNKNKVGVDIETKFDQTFKLRTKFCSAKELEFIQKNPKKSALIWSAKESIYKAYGKKRLIFKEDMQIEDVEKFNFRFSKINSPLIVEKIIEEQYILTFVNLNIPNPQL